MISPCPAVTATLTEGLEGSACAISPVSCSSPTTAICSRSGGGWPWPCRWRTPNTPGRVPDRHRVWPLTQGFQAEVPHRAPLPLKEGVGAGGTVRLFRPGGGPWGWKPLPVPGESQPVGAQILYFWKGERFPGAPMAGGSLPSLGCPTCSGTEDPLVFPGDHPRNVPVSRVGGPQVSLSRPHSPPGVSACPGSLPGAPSALEIGSVSCSFPLALRVPTSQGCFHLPLPALGFLSLPRGPHLAGRVSLTLCIRD